MLLLNGDFHPVEHLQNNICKTASWAVYPLFHYLIYLYANNNCFSFISARAVQCWIHDSVFCAAKILLTFKKIYLNN